MFKPTSPNTQQAFTLVELLTVMVVLVALASITIKTTAQFSFDSRYQITEDRYDKIKTAILGNPNQTINGHPSISGFVADMGRLPSCIRELIDGYNCSTNSQDTAWNIYGLCTDSSTTPATITIEKAANCVTPKTWISLGIGAGWRGAYIETTNDPSNSNAFVDGWGRISSTDAANVCTDVTYTTQADCITNSGKWFNPNYGWFFDDTTTTNAIYIKSFGKDQALGGSEEFDKDFPENTSPTVNSNDWLVTPPVVNVVITPIKNPLQTLTSQNRTLLTVTNCTSFGGTWVTTYTTPQCDLPTNTEYIQSECIDASVGGTWDLTTKCSKIKVTTVASVTVASFNSKSICLDLYYRESGIVQHIQNQTPNPQVIENGMTQIVSFALTGVNIPVGKAAFRITDCATHDVYPISTRPPQIVSIMPNSQTLDFTW